MVRFREEFIKQDAEGANKIINKFYCIRMRTSVQRYLKDSVKIGYILENIFKKLIKD